jgi:plasmid stabilization system protein ParE
VASVTWTAPALEDLHEIWAFIARDSELAADGVVARVLGASERLAEFPISGRMVPEKESEAVREIIVGSYRVMYEILSDDEIEVVAVIHGARSLDL